jgi:tRNA(Ile)-lysidine synthase
VAKEVGALKIAVGHTADDQAETVLMHVLRGAGLSGLAGMRYRVAVPSCQDDQVVLVRPLLQVSRRRIEAYCAAHGLVPRTDASNLDETLFRNRVRHEVLPFLERIRPGVWQSLVQLGELAAADELALEELLAQQWAGLVNQAARGEVTLDRSVWQELPLSLRRRALRRAVYLATAGGGPPDFGQLEAARRQSETGQSGTEVQFADGARLEVRYDRLVFTAVPWGQPVDSLEFPQLEPGIELAVPAPRWDVPLRGWGVPVPGGVALPNSGWRVETQRLSAGEQLLSDARHNTDRWQAYLDADQAGEPVVLRTRRPGERFQPLGLAGRSMLVSDFMVNQRIPRRYRAGMPLLSNAAGQILWIPGYRLAHPVRITTDTRTALRISLRRL